MSYLDIALWCGGGMVAVGLLLAFVGSKIDDNYPGHW